MSHSLLPSLTLIVATTPSLGLGYNGGLPWPPLKADLAFFARITKRPPPSSHRNRNISAGNCSLNDQMTTNAVIMGRKTWESIPPKFRPLRGRINVVVSRQAGKLDGKDGEVLMRVGSIEEGLRQLQQLNRSHNAASSSEGDQLKRNQQENFALGRVFVIGGAEIYATALQMDCCERILWTRIEKEWECDVWFPKGVLEKETASGKTTGWAKRPENELDDWCGEEGIGKKQKEGEVEFRVEMWERQQGEERELATEG